MVELIRHFMERWWNLPGWDGETVALEITSNISNFYTKEQLEECGITFIERVDKNREKKTNLQKLNRWLGRRVDTDPDPEVLLNLLPVISALMPEELRVEFHRAAFKKSSLIFHVGHTCNYEGDVDILAALKTISKESAEAEQALIDLLDGIDPGELPAAQKELEESIAAKKSTLAMIKKLRKERGE